MTHHTHDVAIVGGGAAGLSAAVALARSLRSVVVVDAGEPRNAPAAGAHNVLGREGIAPLELLAAGREEAERYGAEIRRDRAVAVRHADDVFVLQLAGTGEVRARRLLLATGLVDELPDVPGVREFWGGSVLHCPYCHGWEVRGQRIAVLGVSAMSVHQALLFSQLSDQVTFFTHTMPELDDEARAQMRALGIPVVSGVVERLRGEDGTLRGVALEDGSFFPADAVVVAPRFLARAQLYEQLGGKVSDHVNGAFIEAGPTGKTEIPGVWAAGNVSDLSAMVAVASGAGLMAGVAINADLVMEDAAAAVRAMGAGADRG